MNITSLIIESPSGGTSSLTGDELPVTGFFVGGVIPPLVLDASELWTSAARRQIDEFVERLNGPTVGVLYLGWWLDEDTDKVWIDGTTWHETEPEAVRTGRKRREIAIFDIERGRELRLAHAEGE
jgi:hypothetical protein